MKASILAVVFVCALITLGAVSFTLDNNIRPIGQYSSWNAAYGAAADGDTIYVYPSPYDYGNFNVAKRLTVIGAGLNPADPDYISSKINLCVGSAAGTGCLFSGLHMPTWNTCEYQVEFSHCRFDGQLSVRASNSIVEDCQLFSHLVVGNGSVVTNGFVISGCSFEGGSLKPASLTDLACYNSLFIGNISHIDLFLNAQVSCYIKNCVFVNSGTGTHALASIWGSPVSLNFVNCIVETSDNPPAQNYLYCIFEGSSANITDPSNQQNVDLALVMVDVNGGDYHLIPGSLASGTGYDGEDIGLYGGGMPFNDLWYLTRLPSVTELICPPLIDQNGQLNVYIEVQCGN